MFHKKVMIVDDDEFTCNVLGRFLLQQGFSWVETIMDPRDVCRAARESTPDIIVLDLMMPYLSGLEVIEHLRDQKLLTTTRVIMLTAMEDELAREQAISLGVLKFVTKPITPAEFTAAIEDCLDLPLGTAIDSVDT